MCFGALILGGGTVVVGLYMFWVGGGAVVGFEEAQKRLLRRLVNKHVPKKGMKRVTCICQRFQSHFMEL